MGWIGRLAIAQRLADNTTLTINYPAAAIGIRFQTPDSSMNPGFVAMEEIVACQIEGRIQKGSTKAETDSSLPVIFMHNDLSTLTIVRFSTVSPASQEDGWKICGTFA